MVLVGSSTLPGNRYGDLNQDYVIVDELYAQKELRRHHWHQCYVAVVLDGHGMLGELASRDGGKAILGHLKHCEVLKRRQLGDLSKEELQHLVEAAFAAGHESTLQLYSSPPRSYDFPKGGKGEHKYMLRTHGNGDAVYSNAWLGNRVVEFGTTATLAMLQGRTLVVANVGDTSAVLGRDVDETYHGEEITARHHGFEPDEAARLKAGFGDVVSIAPEDGYLTVEEGRLRGFQLAMTRALGHKLLASYGVIATPSFTVRELQPEDVCLIVATDGVWEVMTPSEAVRTVCDAMAEGRSVQDAAHALCAEAVRLALTCRRPGEADNTTAAVFIFDEL